MSIQVKSEEYHDGIGLTWDDTGQPLSKREGQAWWGGWDEGRKDGEIDTREEMADEIERLRETIRQADYVLELLAPENHSQTTDTEMASLLSAISKKLSDMVAEWNSTELEEKE